MKNQLLVVSIIGLLLVGVSAVQVAELQGAQVGATPANVTGEATTQLLTELKAEMAAIKSQNEAIKGENAAIKKELDGLQKQVDALTKTTDAMEKQVVNQGKRLLMTCFQVGQANWALAGSGPAKPPQPLQGCTSRGWDAKSFHNFDIPF